ncbi:hypothetical protein AMTR_s00025p00227680 [Amborella trichopoda]|uniref:Uncharacterized protein n=3 Tax=Amborella trichopoda TaxID=13333 RepID=W1PWR1_AMBTC|nr:hypothetical protein AMTR_s00025p00227680 [Amborella trichopoda]
MANFQVEIIQQDTVVPALPLEESRVPLSNLDLFIPPVDFGVFFCYKQPLLKHGYSEITGKLKKSLSEVLVSYYVLSGEIVVNNGGKPEILCGSRGVEFLEASAEIELKDLDLHKPDESVEGKIIPTKKWGVFCVQLTKLKCGSIVVACTFDHRVADAYSANMFLIS